MRAPRLGVRGFSLAELAVVVAVLAIAAAVAVPMLTRTTKTADRGAAVAAVRERMKALATEAASTSRDVAFVPSSVEHGATVVINPKEVSPPEDAVAASSVTFQAGTGYPVDGGRRAAAAVIVAEAGSPKDAVAVVAGPSGSIATYRRTEQGWEEAR